MILIRNKFWVFRVVALFFLSGLNGCNDKSLLDLSSDPDVLIEDDKKYRARKDFSEHLLHELEGKKYTFFTIADFDGSQNNVIGIEWLRNGSVKIKITNSKMDVKFFDVICKIIENNFAKTNINNVQVQFYEKLTIIERIDDKNLKTSMYAWQLIMHERMLEIR